MGFKFLQHKTYIPLHISAKNKSVQMPHFVFFCSGGTCIELRTCIISQKDFFFKWKRIHINVTVESMYIQSMYALNLENKFLKSYIHIIFSSS